MRRGRWALLLVAVAVVVAAAAGVGLAARRRLPGLPGAGGDPGAAVGGTAEVRWRRSETGVLTAPADAAWCAAARRLDVRAFAGDTGFGLALYPVDSPAPGRYPVRRPGGPESRPWAAVALRWLADAGVRGFQGDSGEVALERDGGGALTARIGAGARSVTDAARVELTGSVRGLRVRPAGPGCEAVPGTGQGQGVD